MFPDTDVSGWTTKLAEQKRAADELFAQWRRQHGTARDDKAFLLWVAQRVPRPPSADQRAAEIGQLRTLARARTAAGRRAAGWLEVHGKEDIWQLYLSDQRELIPAGKGDAERTQLKAALKLAGTINGRLDARYRQPSPYVLDPSLRPEKKRRTGSTCPCSYPSGHAASAAAAVTVLGSFAPHRAADYRWMQAEVVYSRVYMSGHVPSDILAGALLGDLVGEYVLATASRTGSPGVTL
ncbi:phosphatase PAP2 family protein [Streptomyces sp. NPDC002577]